MKTHKNGRDYVIRALEESGAACPAAYINMLKETPENKTILGLLPWAFDHDPESAIQFCSEAVGYPVLPFAQAIGEDMMACFLSEPLTNPAVLVINPWSQDRSAVLMAKLANYEAWLDYAADVARQVSERDNDEDGDD